MDGNQGLNMLFSVREGLGAAFAIFRGHLA